MELKILCTPTFSADEIKMIDACAKSHGLTREEFVRRAVDYFSRECVPTQLSEAKPSKNL